MALAGAAPTWWERLSAMDPVARSERVGPSEEDLLDSEVVPEVVVKKSARGVEPKIAAVAMEN